MVVIMTAREIVGALKGRWSGSYGMAPCPVHVDRVPSLKIWDGKDGPLVHCYAGCSWESVRAALREQGLLPAFDSRPVAKPDPDIVAKREAEQQADERRRNEQARAIWRDAVAAPGTPVEVYLQARGLTLPIPSSIRYANLKHGPTGQVFPTMIGAVQGPDGEITGIHRTYLRKDGQVKAPVSGNKMMLGKCAGGAVRLAKATAKLAIAEGIETALSVQQGAEIATWACLSTSGLKAVLLPPEVREVVICADNDEPGEQAARNAAQRFLREGRSCKIARPIRKDFNDDLMLNDNVVRLRRRTANG